MTLFFLSSLPVDLNTGIMWLLNISHTPKEHYVDDDRGLMDDWKGQEIKIISHYPKIQSSSTTTRLLPIYAPESYCFDQSNTHTHLLTTMQMLWHVCILCLIMQHIKILGMSQCIPMSPEMSTAAPLFPFSLFSTPPPPHSHTCSFPWRVTRHHHHLTIVPQPYFSCKLLEWPFSNTSKHGNMITDSCYAVIYDSLSWCFMTAVSLCAMMALYKMSPTLIVK